MNCFPFSVHYNRLLRALPIDELNLLGEFLEPVTLAAGSSLYRLDEPSRYIYFPENCLISWITTFRDGTSVEQGSIGREGIVGAELYLSTINLNREARVQIGGRALKMRTEKFLSVMKSETGLKKLVREYLAVYLDQTSQIGACNAVHCLDERVARLLLNYQYLTGQSLFKLTQDCIAQMLGVCRPPVSHSAAELRDKKIIRYMRGTLSIIDRQKLGESACECYEIIKSRYQSYELFLTRQFTGSGHDGHSQFLNAGGNHR